MVFALLLTLGGGALLIYFVMFANGWRGWMLMAAGLMFGLGAVWLYSDFIDARPNERA